MLCVFFPNSTAENLRKDLWHVFGNKIISQTLNGISVSTYIYPLNYPSAGK